MSGSGVQVCYICTNKLGKADPNNWVGCEGCKFFGKDTWAHLECANLKGIRKDILKDLDWVCRICKSRLEHYSRLEKKLDSIDAKLDQILGKVATSSDEIRCKLDTVKTDVEAVASAVDVISADTTIPSAQQQAGSHSSTLNYATALKTGKKTEKKNILVIKPEGSKSMSELEKDVITCMRETPVMKTQVLDDKIVLKLSDQTTLGNAKNAFANLSDVRVNTGSMLRPKIIITYVDDLILYDKDTGKDCIQSLIQKNDYLKNITDIEKKMEFVIRIKAFEGTSHYVLKIDPEVREVIHNRGDKLFMNFGMCNVRNRYHVLMCHNCQGFRHKADECDFKAHGPICPKCAGPHKMNECNADPTSHKCINCTRKSLPEVNHRANDRKNCPTLLEEIGKIKSNTENGY